MTAVTVVDAPLAPAGALSKSIVFLSGCVAVLSALAAGLGLWLTGGQEHATITVRGGIARIYGQGLYRDDSVMMGAGFQGQDAVTLFIAVPLLLLSVRQYTRQRARGSLLLSGALAYFLYVYASMAFAAAYNRLFLLYVALLSASFFAFALTLTTSWGPASALIGAATRMPRRLAGAFFLASGVVTFVVWTVPIASALGAGVPPAFLDHYTTAFTHAFDLALIVPVCFVTGIAILRERPSGYVLAFPLLGLIVLLAPMIALATWWQREAGIAFTRGEMLGPVAGFFVLGIAGLGLGALIWRRLERPA